MKVLYLTILIFQFTNANSQWIQTNGPFGEQINAICHSSNDLYVGTQNGVYRSKDNGQNWILISHELMDDQIWSLHFSDGILYAGSNSRLYVTQDNGESWSTITNHDFGMLYCIYKSNEKIFVGTNNGLFVSKSDLTFQEIMTNNEHYYQSHMITKFDSTLFLASAGPSPGNTLYKSTDNGITWMSADSGIVYGFVESICKVNGKLLATAYRDGLYSSINNGNSWIKINPSDTIDSNTMQDLLVLGKYLIVKTDFGIFRSDTASLHWEKLCNCMVRKIDLKDNLLIAGVYNKGIKISNDSGITWHFANNGFSYQKVRTLFGINGSLQATTANAGSFYSFDKGSKWLNYTDTIDEPITFTANDSFYFYGSYDGIFRSRTGTSNWEKVSSNLLYYRVKAIWGDNNLIIAFGTGNYNFAQSKDNGQNWSVITTDTPIFKITSLFSFNDIIYVGTERGLFMFTSNGNQWNFIRSVVVFYHINNIVVKGSTIYVATSYGVYKSENNGIDWFAVNDGLQYGNVKGITVSGNRLLICAGEEGIFILNKNESKWESITDDLPEEYLNGIAVDETNIYVGTANYGVLKRSLSELTGTENLEDKETYYEGIFPNPAHTYFTINHCKGCTQVKIFDILGRQIISKSFSSHFDISDLNNGLYFIQFMDNLNSILIEQKLIVQH